MALKFPLTRWSNLAFAAASGVGQWTDVLKDVAGHVGAEGAVLFSPIAAASRRPAFIVNWGSSTIESGHSYLKYWHTFDPWNRSASLASQFSRAGSIRHGHEFVSDRALAETAYYNEFCRPLGGGRILCLKISDGREDLNPAMHLTLIRPLKSGAFEERAVRALRALHPHLSAATRLHWAANDLVNTRLVVSDLLDDLPQPIWLLEVDGRVVHSNAPAERLMRTTSNIHIEMGRLKKIGRLSESTIRADIHSARVQSTSSRSTTLEIDRLTRSATLQFSTVNEASRLRANWPAGRIILVVSIESPDLMRLELHRLRQEYHLTPSEQAVLEMLVAGNSVVQIAQLRRASTCTIRTHLRALFDKTGQRRQVDLVRLVTGHAGPVCPTVPISDSTSRN